MFEVWFLVNKFLGKLRGFFNLFEWGVLLIYHAFPPLLANCDVYILWEDIICIFISLSWICGVVVWTFNIFQLECKWYGAFLEYKITITLKGIKNAAALKKILHNRYIYIYYTPKINLILVTKVLSYKNKCKKKENSQDDDDIWPFENEIEVFPFFVCISLISH